MVQPDPHASNLLTSFRTIYSKTRSKKCFPLENDRSYYSFHQESVTCQLFLAVFEVHTMNLLDLFRPPSWILLFVCFAQVRALFTTRAKALAFSQLVEQGGGMAIRHFMLKGPDKKLQELS